MEPLTNTISQIFSSDFYTKFRVIVYTLLAATTFYNAARFKGLMKLWFGMQGAMFIALSVTTYLRLVDSPYYIEFNDDVFTPIVIVMVVIAIAFVINHRIKPPFNRRKDDV